MDIRHVSCHIGLPAPMKLLQLTDTHFCLADESDSPSRRRLATRREAEFGVPMARLREIWDELVRYGREHDDAIVHTGDFIDFVSHANLRQMAACLREMDIFFATGGHEFIQDLDELIDIGMHGRNGETPSYKLESIEKVRQAVANDVFFSSRLVRGVNLVSVDDSYYTFSRAQLRLLQTEVAKGHPIVLLMHGPLHTRALYDEMMRDSYEGRGPAWLVGTPDELRAGYSPQMFALQQPDADTFAFIDYVKREPAVKLLLTGHLHRFWTGELAPGKLQVVTDMSNRGCATELTLT